MKRVRVAIVGVGNCASSLVQGGSFYRRTGSVSGLIHETIGDYGAGDVDFVLGIDIDARKVGKPLAQAIFAPPNNTKFFEPNLELTSAMVIKGPVLDGVAAHMLGHGDRGFQISDEPEASKEEIVAALRQERVDVLVNFLPVGSTRATEFYMECALEAGVGVVNCIPVFIASRADWERRFRERGLPIIGDDVKAQVGATIIHRTLAALFANRGAQIERTYQLNTGGNTDFMNMLDQDRLVDKKTSKTEAVQSALAERLADENIRIGPSEYVPWQKDNKVCFLRLEASQWGNVPLNVELRLSVEDSPNAAACVMDAIRFCKVAMEQGRSGVLIPESAFLCKHPPEQMGEEEALRQIGGQLRDDIGYPAAAKLDAAE